MVVERTAGPAGRSFSGSLRVKGSGTWIYVSGKMGTDASGELAPGGLGPQAEAALRQVVSCIEEAGGGPENVVKLTAYLTSLEDYETYNAVRGEVFGSTLPASTAIGVADLIIPGAVIEIDGVAYLPDGNEHAG